MQKVIIEPAAIKVIHILDSQDGRIKSLTRRGEQVIRLGASGSWDDTTVQLPSVIKVADKLWVSLSFSVLGK